jgi:hypothetical protein
VADRIAPPLGTRTPRRADLVNPTSSGLVIACRGLELHLAEYPNGSLLAGCSCGARGGGGQTRQPPQVRPRPRKQDLGLGQNSCGSGQSCGGGRQVRPCYGDRVTPRERTRKNLLTGSPRDQFVFLFSHSRLPARRIPGPSDLEHRRHRVQRGLGRAWTARRDGRLEGDAQAAPFAQGAVRGGPRMTQPVSCGHPPASSRGSERGRLRVVVDRQHLA